MAWSMSSSILHRKTGEPFGGHFARQSLRQSEKSSPKFGHLAQADVITKTFRQPRGKLFEIKRDQVPGRARLAAAASG